MIAQHSVLVQLVGLLDHSPAPSCSTSHRRRERPVLYSDALLLKALVIMIVRHIRIAPLLIEELPKEASFVLGDKHYNSKNLERRCQKEGRFMVSPKRGAYPHTDEVAEVRKIFHLLRHRA